MNTTLEKIVSEWRNNKGIGSVILSKEEDEIAILKDILSKMNTANINSKRVIVVETFGDRSHLLNELKEVLTENTKLFTANFVESISTHASYYDLIILYNLDNFKNHLESLTNHCKFRLGLFNNRLTDADAVNRLYNLCPKLSNITNKDLLEMRYSTPVEEIQIGIDITDTSEDYSLLQKYNEYIQQSIAIFGSLDIMNQCRIGNAQLNISAYQLCANIANENGWSDHLDMTIPFNKEIDSMYNPGSLRERANLTYDIIRKRQNLLSDYKDKIKEIDSIYTEHTDKKILIINKRGEFANEVTYQLNMTHGNVCGNFHDRVDPIPQYDVNGNIVVYKSGANKGTPKLLKADAQKTYYLECFNRDIINVLSTNNIPDQKLNLTADIVIITSPMCKTLKEYLYRLNGLKMGQKLTLYTLYIKNSLEEKLLDNRELLPNQRVVKNCKNDANSIDFNDFVIDD